MELLTTKALIERLMFSKLETMFPEMPQYQIRKISLAMSELAGDELMKTNEKTNETYKGLVLEYEQNRKKFRDTINTIEARTKGMLDNMKRDNLIQYKTNPKTKRNELVGRSNVLTDVVKFINELDEVVMDFYENVYKIKDDKSVQTNLFT